MWEKFQQWYKEYKEIEGLLSDPAIISERQKYQTLMRKLSNLRDKALLYQRYLEITKAMEDLKAVSDDSELKELIEEERKELECRLGELEKEAEELLLEDIPDANRGVIMEIRAGTGGLEATLFAADLFRMYSKYAEKMGWKVEIMDVNPSEIGGYKEIVFSISGEKVYYYLRYESGVHRVQRVPVTEAGGRIHTSAASVVVLTEPEEVEIQIDPKDLRIDVFRSSGPGGQSVNTSDSAVRITHIPTGIVVTCQDERSQLKNKEKAMRVLKARLLDMEKKKQQQELSDYRRKTIGSGDRSEKIRTYNFPDHRVTDHRIGFTTYQLEKVLEGELDEIIGALLKAEKELLKQEKM